MIKKNIARIFFVFLMLPNFVLAQTLEEVLVITYENNDTLKARREELKIADEKIMQALSGFLPTIGVSKQLQRQKVKNQVVSGNLVPERTYSGTTNGIAIKQNLFSSGYDLANLRKAKHEIEQARANLLQYEQKTLLSAIQLYLGVAKAQMQLDVYEKKVTALGKSLEAEEARYKAGEKTKTDVAQARSNYSNAVASKIKASGDLVVAKAQFLSVVTVEPEHVNLPVDNVLLPQTIDQATEIALKKNPDLIASEQQYKAADRGIDAARAGLLPSADLSYQRQSNSFETQSSGTLTDTTSVTFTVPVFNSGNWSQLRAAKRTAQFYKYTTLNRKQAIVEGTVKAWQDYEISKAAIHAQEDALESAKIAYEGMKEEERAGTRSTVDVIVAQNEYFNADINLVEARVQNIFTRYTLKSAIGELTARDLDLKVNFYDPLQNYNKIRWELIGSF